MRTPVLAFLGNFNLLVGYLFFLVLVGLYFLPSIVGYSKRNFSGIFLLNLLPGWTMIGWVVALVWAVTYEAPQQPNTPVWNNERTPSGNTVDQITKLVSLRNSGAIAEDEYERQKQEILNS